MTFQTADRRRLIELLPAAVVDEIEREIVADTGVLARNARKPLTQARAKEQASKLNAACAELLKCLRDSDIVPVLGSACRAAKQKFVVRSDFRGVEWDVPPGNLMAELEALKRSARLLYDLVEGKDRLKWDLPKTKAPSPYAPPLVSAVLWALWHGECELSDRENGLAVEVVGIVLGAVKGDFEGARGAVKKWLDSHPTARESGKTKNDHKSSGNLRPKQKDSD